MSDVPVFGLDEFGTTPSIKSDRAVLLDRLREAARAESTLRCVYFGSAKGGVERNIIPIKIDPPDVWAHCVESGRRQRFRLGRIYILAPGEDPRWARPLEDRSEAVKLPSRIDTRNIKTLSQLVADHGEALDALGWRIALSDRAIALHRITDEDGEAVVALRQNDNGQWIAESLGARPVKRRRLGVAAKVFLAAAERNARSTTAPSRRSKGSALSWEILGFLGLSAFALALGLTIGVLLPH